MNDIPMSDVQRSVQAILEETTYTTSPQLETPNLNLSHHPTAFTPPPPPLNAWAKKAEGVIEAVEVEARAIGDSLSSIDDTFPSGDALRSLLKTATHRIDSAGKSLASVKNQTLAVLEHKAKVLAILRSIDSRMSQLGALLPPPTPEETPVIVQAGKYFSLPQLC